jgi:hypothetical protein
MILPIIAGYLVYSKPGYELQKYFLPIAFQVDLPSGTHERGIGYNISYGLPKTLPYAKRKDFGSTYYKKSYGEYEGWQHRKGSETSYILYTKAITEYSAGEISQIVLRKSFGIPSILGVDVTNDLWGDGGDRYRTSSQVVNFGFIRFGNLIFTGDPGPSGKREIEYLGGDTHGTYVSGQYGDPDKYRNGILYLGIGPVEVGLDSEVIRNTVQNTVHNIIGSPHFKNLIGTDKFKDDKFFFQFGYSGW